jgi:general secretion pathway protein G
MKRRDEPQPPRRRQGFTLIEILLVVVIIGLLASIAAINIPGILDRGRVSKAKGDVHNLAVALNAFYMEEGKLPSELGALTAGDDPLMSSIPSDPWGHEYQYAVPGTHGRGRKFDLYSLGPDGTQSGDDIGNWNLDEKKAGPAP